MGAIESFTKEMLRKGYEVTTKLISLLVIEADDTIKERLNIEKGENVWEIKRVRYANGEPVSYMITYMPVKMFPNLKKDDCISLYNYIRDNNYNIYKANRTIEAIISNAELINLLELDSEAPILHIEQVGILQNGEAFEYSDRKSVV